MSENRSSTQPAGLGGFSAADMKRRMAEHEAAKAAEDLRHMKEQEEKQKAVMEEFHKPLERTAEQLMQVVMQLVSHAAERGQSEVQSIAFQMRCAAIAAEGSTTRNPTGKRPWRAAPNSLTNSGAISSGRSASTSKLKCSSIRAACRAISASFSAGSKTHLGQFLRNV